MGHFNEAPLQQRLLEPRDVVDGRMGEIDERVASLMGALSSTTRVRTLYVLLEEGELSVGEIAKAVGMSESATSHQLRLLRNLGLVRRRRQGRRGFYGLADDHLGVLLREALYHVDHGRLAEGRQGLS